MANHLHKINQDLNQNWNLRNENFDKDVLFGVIMREFGDMEVLEKNPKLFKYYVDIWWERKYRTFEKWWNAFDLSYDPLINNWFKEDRILSENEQGNTFNKFKNNDTQTDHHIGDAFSNEDFHNEYEDHDVANEVTDNDTSSRNNTVEVTDNDTASIKTNAQQDDKTINNIKDGTNKEISNDESHTNTKSSVTVDVKAASFSNEHSGGAKGEFINDEYGDLSVTEQDDERSNETKVSAYNSSDYEPSQKDITHGDMSNEGRNTSSTTTHGDSDDNEVQVIDDTTKDTTYSELSNNSEQNKMNAEEHNQGSLDQTVTSNEIGSATDDTVRDYTDDKNGENTNNKQTTSNDKYINNSEGLHTGDSQQKNTVDRTVTENNSRMGNLGTMTAQAMLTSEIKIQGFDLYNAAAELFADDNLICIYERGGCCCLW